MKIEPYPVPEHAGTPVKAGGVAELRAPPSEADPLEEASELVEAAMSIVGLGGWIAQACRVDGCLGFIALAQQLYANFKVSTWRAVLRWAHYLVATAQSLEMRFQPPKTAEGWFASGDASSVNAVDEEGQLAGNFAGWTLHFPGSAPFAYGCVVLRGLGAASAHAELRVYVLAAKMLVAFRMLARELGFHPPHPTGLLGDSKAAFDGSLLDKLPRKERFLAAQKAMLRLWIRSSVLAFIKASTKALRPDILSKSDFSLEAFRRLAHWVQRGTPLVEDGERRAEVDRIEVPPALPPAPTVLSSVGAGAGAGAGAGTRMAAAAEAAPEGPGRALILSERVNRKQARENKRLLREVGALQEAVATGAAAAEASRAQLDERWAARLEAAEACANGRAEELARTRHQASTLAGQVRSAKRSGRKSS